MGAVTLAARRRELAEDADGRRGWREVTEPRTVEASETALLLCDVWDRHGCAPALARLTDLLPRIDRAVRAARERGVLIVHAPSDTMAFYRDHPARLRAVRAPRAPDPVERPHDDPPLPVDDSDGGCDGPGNSAEPVWTRQNAAIGIDPDRDVISDDGRELVNVYHQRGIRHVLVAGVHTNMCVLHRSFAIKRLVKWGFDAMLVRDLTDALYNPARPPYVSYREGFRLVVEYVEKFWCPSVASEDLLA